MQSNERSAIVNDEFIVRNANLEDENFRCHLHSKDQVGRVGPRAVDIADDVRDDQSEKLHIVQDHSDNMVCFRFSSSIQKLIDGNCSTAVKG
ncbi:unnamed protein product [Litomosoides sigmodontis]|uniref:Uncharacterized protein n=1 Tax=Litomosoides sigmodontis TaxID=42156 RepID=A0A3P6UXI0_LITSI|nr:unnamed protein product [Litomosoides sigmodontis]